MFCPFESIESQIFKSNSILIPLLLEAQNVSNYLSFKIGFYFACKTCTHLCPLLVLRPLSARPKKGLVVVVILALPAKVMVTNGLGFSQWPFFTPKLLRWQKVAPIGKRLLNKGTRSSLLLNMALVLGKCPRKLWWPFQSALFILNDLIRKSGKKVKNSRNFFWPFTFWFAQQPSFDYN